MDGAELVELPEAAHAFGVSQETLRRRLEVGSVPEAVHDGQSWSLPTEALADIAGREGWPLDLTGRRTSAAQLPEQLDRYISETLAAHAAVVLAKTQAAAARAEAQELSSRYRRASEDLDAERAERERVTTDLTRSEQSRGHLDKQLAVSEARSEEIRAQLEHERSQRTFLTQRIGMLEQERDDLYASLGWLGRRRLQISRNGTAGASGQLGQNLRVSVPRGARVR